MRVIRPLALFLALSLFPASAAADQVRIRSGEHAAFSRLVLDFSERPGWSVARVDGAVTITFAPGAWAFETGAIFRMIPRSRIRDVSQTGEDTIRIEIGCDCTIDIFPVREAGLAIDVADPSQGIGLEAIRQTTGEIASDLPAPQIATTGLTGFVGPSLIRTGEPQGAVTVEHDKPRGDRLAFALGRSSAFEDPPPALLAVDPPKSRPTTSNLTRSLSEEIGRAASMGILQATRPSPSTGISGNPDEASGPAGDMPGVRFRAPDDPGGSMTEERPPRLDAEHCPSQGTLDVGSWYPAQTTPGEALAHARSRLFDELDRVDAERAIALVRLYIAFGFGAEAANVLVELVPDHRDGEYLLPIARILDGDVGHGGVDTFKGCSGRAQLWSMLSGAPPRDHQPEDILVALSELPLHLRRLLGPRIDSAFAGLGDSVSSESTRQLVTRAPGPHGSAVEMWEARNGATDGEPDGIRMLAALARGGSAVSAEALASYLELSIDSDGSPGVPYLELAEARAYELRGSALGHRLSAAIVRGRLALGEFGAAFERLEAYRTILPDEMHATLEAAFLESLGDDGSDADLLLYAARTAENGLFRMPTGTALAIAGRLLDLGFASLASKYLSNAPDNQETRLLSARAALTSGDPGSALLLVRDIPEDRAIALRAEGLAALGRHAEAARLFRQIDAGPESASALWRSGDWKEIAETSDEARSRAAELAVADAPPPRDPLELLDRSAGARSRLEALIEAMPRP